MPRTESDAPRRTDHLPLLLLLLLLLLLIMLIHLLLHVFDKNYCQNDYRQLSLSGT